MAWVARGGRDGPPIYRDRDLFSIRMLHGGQMRNIEYVNGSVAYFDFCDKHKISLIEIHAMVHYLGYENQTITYWYRLQCQGISGALTMIKTEQDVFDMCALVDYNVYEIEIILEHNMVQHVVNVNNQYGSSNNGVDQCVGVNDQTIEFVNQPYLVSEAATHVEFDDFSGPIHAAEDDTIDDEGYKESDSSEGDDTIDCDVVDSEWEMNEDDQDFEANVDYESEWAGSNSRPSVDYIHEEEVPQIEFKDDDGDMCSDEDCRSAHDSDDDDDRDQVHYPEFNPYTDMKNPQFKLGMLFSDCIVFRRAVKQYAIINGKNITFWKSEKYRLGCYCDGEEGQDGICPWEMYVSRKNKVNNTLQIKVFKPEHMCSRIHKNKNATAEWLVRMFIDRVQSDPNIPLKSIIDAASSEFNVGVSRTKAYRAKMKALELIQGSQREQYGLLWDYCGELRKTNPGTTCKILSDGARFQRMYVCLGACKIGFKEGCRPIIGLDGCHLKGVCGGQLLTAVGIDANNETWVVAYAVVEMENKDSWTWFLELLVADLDIENHFGWTFISDKQKGLPGAFEATVPNSEHMFCTRHLFTNFRKAHKGKTLSDLLWKAAKSTTVQHFGRAMEELRVLDDKAWKWLAEKPPSQWSRSHFTTHVKCDMIMNNLCEAFNQNILQARDKPIITMLEMIRCLLMRRIMLRREKMKKWPHAVCPKIFHKLQDRKVEAAGLTAMWSGGPQFQINGGYGEQYKVDLDLHTCGCRKWDLSGIPCKHAITAIHYKGGKPVEEYVDTWNLKKTYMKSYDNLVLPMNGQSMWERSRFTPLQPPSYTRQPGRPRKLRKKGPEETIDKTNKTRLGKKGVVMTCKNCGKTGHNTRTCHRNLPPKPPGKRGRPKKVVQQTSQVQQEGQNNHVVTQGSHTSTAPLGISNSTSTQGALTSTATPPTYKDSLRKNKRGPKTRYQVRATSSSHVRNEGDEA